MWDIHKPAGKITLAGVTDEDEQTYIVLSMWAYGYYCYADKNCIYVELKW